MIRSTAAWDRSASDSQGFQQLARTGNQSFRARTRRLYSSKLVLKVLSVGFSPVATGTPISHPYASQSSITLEREVQQSQVTALH
ncbi:MAG: hypothetical protein KME13_22950 [Myxacorys californica WJT36-NPBG1]|nr:hypothetical protein [Myxacorys californica WJT36-NPBG1]